jgi:hypothetical protein
MKLIVMIVVSFLGSCATQSPAPGGEAGPPKSIVFVDADFFDSQLSNAMKAQSQSVSVSFVEPVTTNTIPERLDKWLYVLVNRYGGTVDVQLDPDYPAPKDVSAIVMSIALKVYAYAKEYMLYNPSKNYNAIIYIVSAQTQGQSRITRVVFTRK